MINRRSVCSTTTNQRPLRRAGCRVSSAPVLLPAGGLCGCNPSASSGHRRLAVPPAPSAGHRTARRRQLWRGGDDRGAAEATAARLKHETQLTRAQIASRTCRWNPWTVSRSHLVFRVARFSPARHDLQAEELNLLQLYRFIASRQIWKILYLCCDIVYEEDERRFEKTPGVVGLLIDNTIEKKRIT